MAFRRRVEPSLDLAHRVTDAAKAYTRAGTRLRSPHSIWTPAA
jgi:hypothetical protein